jgi:hypothetical protein
LALVSSGLVLNLDASNATSYSGTGTTWTDLSGNGNTGTLVNGAGYLALNGGTITFDGINDMVTCEDSVSLSQTTSVTVTTWIYATGSTNSCGIITKGPSGAADYDYMLYVTVNSTAIVGYKKNDEGVAQAVGSYIVPGGLIGKWTQIAYSISGGTVANLWVNGISVSTTTFTSGIRDSSNLLNIGFGFQNAFPGHIAQVLIYNRGLSASEMLQNYNTTKTKFGLPDITPTPTPTNSVTPTNTITPTNTVTPTITPTNSVTPTPSITATITPTNSITPTRTITPTATPAVIVSSNLLLHYNTFNTSSYNGSGVTITDISGNSRNGTITGSPTWTGNYFTFSDDYITTPNLSSVITSANEVHSVELWVYPTNNGVLVQYNNTTTPNSEYHHSAIEIVGGNLEVGLWNGSVVGSTGNIGAVSFNQWHQIVLTYNGSVCKGYIDGVYKGSVNVSWTSPMDYSHPLFHMNFGYSTTTSQGDATNFDGRFGIMRVYNKALTDAEVLNNYNVDKSKYGL